MPDVEVRYAPMLDRWGSGRFGHARHPVTRELFLDTLAQKVAQEMDCLDDEGNAIVHDWKNQIAIPVFEPFTGRSRRPLLIVVSAYDWPDRMRNIAERLERIGTRMSSLCGLAEDMAAVSFNPLPRGPYPGGCWVKV